MAGTNAGAIKARDAIYETHGKDFYKNIGSKGGKKGHTGGFFANRELAKKSRAKRW